MMGIPTATFLILLVTGTASWGDWWMALSAEIILAILAVAMWMLVSTNRRLERRNVWHTGEYARREC